MDFEWDPDKAESNRHKHRVDFADAVTVLEDDRALTVEDNEQREQRFITIGADAAGRVLVVAFTYRGETIRIISARTANRRERRQYEMTP